jgi:probable HAF family extracellular repeat protein
MNTRYDHSARLLRALAITALTIGIAGCERDLLRPSAEAGLSLSGSSVGNYTPNDLGNLGGTSSQSHGINDHGHVVGWSRNAAGETRAFLWKNGTMTDLGAVSSGHRSEAHDINNQGRVVGWGWDGWDLRRAFVWHNGVMTVLPGLFASFPQSEAYAINNLGQMVGSSAGLGGSQHAVLWQTDTGIIDLGTLGGTWAEAHGINDHGHVVGRSTNTNGETRAFLWKTDTGMIDLGTLGGNASEAYGINDHGQVVGWSRNADGQSRAFLWQNGTMTDLGVLPGGTTSGARGINDLGQVVGWSALRAVVWHNGTISDLGLLPEAYQSHGAAINGSGQVAGYSDPGFRWHAVLWSQATPAAPSVLRGDPQSATEILLTWNDHSDGTASFQIERRIRGLGGEQWPPDWDLVADDIAPGSTSHNDTAVPPGSSAQYRIRACFGSLCSEWVRANNVDLRGRFAPLDPDNVQLTAPSSTSMQVSWTQPADAERPAVDYYELQRRRTNNGTTDWEAVSGSPLAGSASSYQDSGLQAATLYRYRIRGCNAYGCSGWTASAQVYTPAQ